MRYINIVGTTGSGKSTLARALSKKLQLSYIELDNLLWLDDWQESPDTEFLAKLEHSIRAASQGWVIDNIYTRATGMIWQQVDTIIWLDYSFSLNLYRLFKRTLSRVISRKQLWSDSNNRESFKMMLSKESIFIWMIQKYPKNRQKYLAMMQDPKYQHIQFIHLTSTKQTKAFLQQL
ncbi:AAA family ATPase [Acinetobacter puyangensis]|uniref:AAA domain-containing protein n=1 Tax=Acinetobacter puyangensis TaxID=1096779 RepID=A0A240E548_9GAMM|nr:AAA family ATPase [Acinetobacter puyangensis]SNX43651.1 AAA domain-containing protein [Acinetobacter puyangensis]